MEVKENQNPEHGFIDSKYRKILIAAKRSKQLQRGAKARVSINSVKPTRIAIEEVEQGKIEFEVFERSEE
ncbi:MAG: DNA-directed RNA polymerase subunit omega [Blastocatellia bacterium]|jgi:DNA-directed RNA polymerase omega subunit